MKRFLTISAVCLAISSLVASASAQKPGPAAGGKDAPQGGRPGGMAMGFRGGAGMMDHLKKELNLTPAQETKIKAIMEKYRPQMEALRKSFKPGDKGQIDKSFLEKFKAIRDKQNAEIRAVLTPAQQKKWDDMRSKARMRGPGGPGGGPPPNGVKPGPNTAPVQPTPRPKGGGGKGG
jgi:protein CpxP